MRKTADTRAANFWIFLGDVEMSDEKRARVTDEQFVEVWTEAALNEGTVADVAEKLGLKKESVSVRATTLRKALREQADVELPKMRRRARGARTHPRRADRWARRRRGLPRRRPRPACAGACAGAAALHGRWALPCLPEFTSMMSSSCSRPRPHRHHPGRCW